MRGASGRRGHVGAKMVFILRAEVRNRGRDDHDQHAAEHGALAQVHRFVPGGR